VFQAKPIYSLRTISARCPPHLSLERDSVFPSVSMPRTFTADSYPHPMKHELLHSLARSNVAIFPGAHGSPRSRPESPTRTGICAGFHRLLAYSTSFRFRIDPPHSSHTTRTDQCDSTGFHRPLAHIAVSKMPFERWGF
jgi:hypothetical protein